MNGLSRRYADLAHGPIIESAHKYQNNDFNDELNVSNPAHPLFPVSLLSNDAHNKCGQDWQTNGRSRIDMYQVIHVLRLSLASCTTWGGWSLLILNRSRTEIRFSLASNSLINKTFNTVCLCCCNACSGGCTPGAPH